MELKLLFSLCNVGCVKVLFPKSFSLYWNVRLMSYAGPHSIVLGNIEVGHLFFSSIFIDMGGRLP